jgi:hypothetical protein
VSCPSRSPLHLAEGWRVCGENLFAKHSIRYENLLSYFYGFSIWNERNECLGWDETLEYFELLGITPVEVLYDGIWDEKKIREIGDKLPLGREEGYVIRKARSFKYGEFRHSMAKFVRKNHVTTEDHWRHAQIVANGLTK